MTKTMKTPILTAEEFFKKYSNLYQFEEGSPEYLIDKEDFNQVMIEFAKLHVNEALKSASYEFERVKYDENDGDANQVSTSVILNAYPDSKIL